MGVFSMGIRAMEGIQVGEGIQVKVGILAIMEGILAIMVDILAIMVGILIIMDIQVVELIYLFRLPQWLQFKDTIYKFKEYQFDNKWLR